MFFNGWAGLGRVVLVGALAYVALVLLLRVSGKRTLSKREVARAPRTGGRVN